MSSSDEEELSEEEFPRSEGCHMPTVCPIGEYKISQKPNPFAPPPELAFGESLTLKRQSPTLYERKVFLPTPTKKIVPLHIKVVRVAEFEGREKWQGRASADRCCLPLESLCNDPQQAADALWNGLSVMITALATTFSVP